MSEMTSPNPVPPNFRLVELSACEKALKSFSFWKLEMPIPVSLTEMANVP
jgi:hypothetical protein